LQTLFAGFDILGLALNEPYDIMDVKLLDEPKVIIHNKDEFNLPTEPEKNVAWSCVVIHYRKNEQYNWLRS
jgi:homoserine kinase